MLVKVKYSFLFFVFILIFYSVYADNARNSNFAEVVERVSSSIVNIAVERVSQDSPSVRMYSIGSGVIIDSENGYIVTNAHTVTGQKVMVVTLKDGRKFKAHFLGASEDYDIAVLQISHDSNNLQQIEFADSDLVMPGDSVIAIGSPFGLEQSVTAGVVSAVDRASSLDSAQSFIQTDAPINPGNSGGALFDVNGRVVGINTAIISPISDPHQTTAGNVGIGFAISSNVVKAVSEQIIHNGKFVPGFLGVLVQNFSASLKEAFGKDRYRDQDGGVLVTNVLKGSLALKIGIQELDLITKVNSVKIKNINQLRSLIAVAPHDKKTKISILRDGKMIVLDVKIPTHEDASKESGSISMLDGLVLQKISLMNYDTSVLDGLIVLDVADGSYGAIFGMMPGDIIVSANFHNVSDIISLKKIADTVKKYLLLKLMRGKNAMFVALRLGY